MKKVYISIAAVLILYSCGNSEKKEQALRDLDDAQQTLVSIKVELSKYDSLLTQNIAELEVAKDKAEHTKDFHFLRTEQEREDEIKNATEYKLKIEKNIENIKTNIQFFQDSAQRTEIKIQQLNEFLKN